MFQVQSAFYKVRRGEVETGIEELNKSLVAYENALKDTFFNGSKPGVVDYMLWPWFSYFPLLRETGFVLNADGKLPRLAAWFQSMQADDAVQKNIIPDATTKKFMESMKQGTVDYDIE